MPEKALLIYPSIARVVGVDAALLYSQCSDCLELLGVVDTRQVRTAVISRAQWRRITSLWSDDTIPGLIERLACHSLLQINLNPAGSVQICEIPQQPVPVQEKPDMTACLPVLEQPPLRQPLPVRQRPAKSSQPPAFGGSMGWRKEKDELQQLFEQHEERNQQLRAMQPDWMPSQNFYALLPRHQIPAEFVETCLSEFVLYYLDQERKESNWDQKFLAWTKREWVKKQTQDARERQALTQQSAGQPYENTRRDTRENRKRVTAAIMDIRDTNW